MRCDSFENRLNEILDQRGSPSHDRELRAHAESCGSCRALLAGQQLLFAGLDLADPPEISSGFTSRILARVTEAAPSGATAGIIAPAGAAVGMNSASWWTGGVVAAALLAVVVGWEPLKGLLATTPENGPAIPIANVDPPKQTPEKKVVPVSPVVEVVKPELVQKPNDAPKAVVLTDPQFGRLLEAVQTIPTEEGTELASQFVDGLRPIAEPMNSVLNVVRRGLLGGDNSMQQPVPGKPQAGNPAADVTSAVG